jgi:hypothetical protein
MKHRIDPKIDCVFKALLSSEEKRNLLVHFLNTVLVDNLTVPINKAEMLDYFLDTTRRVASRKYFQHPPLGGHYVQSLQL